MMVKTREDGTAGAFIRNPERNLGWTQYRADRIERDGNSLKLFAADKGAEKGRLLAEGVYREDNDVMTFYSRNRGLSYDFRRAPALANFGF